MLRIRQCRKRSTCLPPEKLRKELVSEISTSSFIDIDFTQTVCLFLYFQFLSNANIRALHQLNSGTAFFVQKGRNVV